MKNIIGLNLILTIVLIIWPGEIVLAQGAGNASADNVGIPCPTFDAVSTEKVLQGLRDEDGDVRARTLDALRNSKLPTQIVEVVGDMVVDDPDSGNRLLGIHVLRKDYSPQRLQFIRRALGDKDAYVRANAAIAIGRWGHDAASAVPQLLCALADRRNMASVDVSYHFMFLPVRYHVATAIGLIRPCEMTDALSHLSEAMEDETAGEDAGMVRIAAALATIRIKNGDAEALEVLQDALSSSSENVRHEAASSIAAAGPLAARALEVMLENILDEKSWYVRSAYMDAFGNLGVRDDRIVEMLIHALDEKGCVREEAIRSLAKMGDFSKRALPKIEAILLSNPDPGDYCTNTAQSVAVEAITQIAQPEVAMRILRDKISQVGDGVVVGQQIIPRLRTRGPESHKNRETLEWLLEQCRRLEEEIVETLNRTADSPSSGGR